MWNHQLKLDKYLYVRTHPQVIRLIGLAGALASVSMGYGFWQFLQLRLTYIIFFGPLAFILISNKFLRYLLQIFYQGFDISKHERFVRAFWKEHKEPAVDIFLPWAGEDLEIHEEVVRAATRIEYENKKIYMLDDVGSIEHQKLAQKYDCIYLSRPNKGEYKKSGNLEFGYNHAQGEFVFILDADFIPTANSLHDMVPYIAADPTIGILQTPQYFEQNDDIHRRSKIEFGGGNIVEEFYKIIMPSRDEFNAAMCVGTSALYRKEAFVKLNGTPKVHASEDLATGLLITQFGYHVKYLPLIISMGKSPDTYQAYFKQHMRWCSGNLVFAEFWPKAKLSVMARLIYLINPFYYLSEALTIVFAFQFLVLLHAHASSLSLVNFLYFLPFIVVNKIISPQIKTNKGKIGTKLAAINNSYTYFYTFIRLFFKGQPDWFPTGLKATSLSQDFLRAINLGVVISSLYIISFAYVLFSKPEIFANGNAYIILAWSFYTLFWHVMYIYFVVRNIMHFRLRMAVQPLHKFWVYLTSHINLALFSTLMGLTAVQVTAVVKNPSVISVKLRNETTPQIASIEMPFVLESELNVLGVSTDEETRLVPEKTEYAIDGDTTPTRLSEKALLKFADTHNIAVSSNQLNYAAFLLLRKSNDTDATTIHFELDDLNAALQTAKTLVEN